MNNTNTPAEGDLRNYKKIEPVKSRLPRKKKQPQKCREPDCAIDWFLGE